MARSSPITLASLIEACLQRWFRNPPWQIKAVSGVSSIRATASLHAKTMAFDRGRVFVGSFNFDRRSARLNTEMGMLIDSPSMAAALAARMDEVAPEGAYRVGLAAGGKAEWVAGWPDGTEARLATEPGTTFLGRLGVAAMSWMPIEWLL